MMPVIPHITCECLDALKINKNDFKWPKVEKKYLESDNCEIVIQINGKKRSIISSKKEITEEELLKNIKDLKLVEKYILNKQIKKTIFVQDKLINLIVN